MSLAPFVSPQPAADEVMVDANHLPPPKFPLTALPPDLLCIVLACALRFANTSPDVVQLRKFFGIKPTFLMHLPGFRVFRLLNTCFRRVFSERADEWAPIPVSLQQAGTLKLLGVAAPCRLTHKTPCANIGTVASFVKAQHRAVHTFDLAATHLGGELTDGNLPHNVTRLALRETPVGLLSAEDKRRITSMPPLSIQLGPNFKKLVSLVVAQRKFDPTAIFRYPEALPNAVSINVIRCLPLTGDGASSLEQLHRTGPGTSVLMLPKKTRFAAFGLYMLDGSVTLEHAGVEVMEVLIGGTKVASEAALAGLTALPGKRIQRITVISAKPLCTPLAIRTETDHLTVRGFIPHDVHPDVTMLCVHIDTVQTGPVAPIAPTDHVKTLTVTASHAVCRALLDAHKGLDFLHINAPPHEVVEVLPSKRRTCQWGGFHHDTAHTLSIPGSSLGDNHFLGLHTHFPNARMVDVAVSTAFTPPAFVGSLLSGAAKRNAVATWAPCVVTIRPDAANPHPTAAQLARLMDVIPHLVTGPAQTPQWVQTANMACPWSML
jgi:hypothetical protein